MYLPFLRPILIVRISALHLILISDDSHCNSDFMAIKTPPPNFLYLLGLEGSSGCDFRVLSSLNTLYVSFGKISLSLIFLLSHVSFNIGFLIINIRLKFSNFNRTQVRIRISQISWGNKPSYVLVKHRNRICTAMLDRTRVHN